jgi:hypothetical protein
MESRRSMPSLITVTAVFALIKLFCFVISTPFRTKSFIGTAPVSYLLQNNSHSQQTNTRALPSLAVQSSALLEVTSIVRIYICEYHYQHWNNISDGPWFCRVCYNQKRTVKVSSDLSPKISFCPSIHGQVLRFQGYMRLRHAQGSWG